MPDIDALRLHEAYRRGDVDGVKAALGDPPDFPNCRGPRGMGENVLEYAIYHSPLAFIRRLLDLGADPNYGHHAGFPSLIAALSADRADRQDLLKLLLDYGADTAQRGVNDYTPLHYAAATDNVPAIELLLARGADPCARTNIDDYATPLEEAERGNHHAAAAALRRHAAK
jgi:ankyrin repeat protein